MSTRAPRIDSEGPLDDTILRMEAVSLFLRIMGLLLILVGWWPTMRAMFAEERLYGYLGFFVPLIALLYAGFHMDELKGPFFVHLAGYVLLVGGILTGRVGSA
jgi:hypothetical protein